MTIRLSGAFGVAERNLTRVRKPHFVPVSRAAGQSLGVPSEMLTFATSTNVEKTFEKMSLQRDQTQVVRKRSQQSLDDFRKCFLEINADLKR